MITSKLTSKAQTTIPQAVRAALHLKAGDEIVYVVEEGRVAIMKARPVPSMTPSSPSANGMARLTVKPMQSFEQGDTIRVPFPYTDRSTRLDGPAVPTSADFH